MLCKSPVDRDVQKIFLEQYLVDIKYAISICCCFPGYVLRIPVMKIKWHLQFKINAYIMSLNDLKGELLLSKKNSIRGKYDDKCNSRFYTIFT